MRTIAIIFSFTISYLSYSQFSQSNANVLQDADVNHNHSQLISDDDVRVYIQNTLNSEVPASHQLNQVYFSYNNYQDAVIQLSNDYPEFYGLTGQNLIDSIRQYPEKYRQLVYDTRLLREFYTAND